jgi:hypothetical protein
MTGESSWPTRAGKGAAAHPGVPSNFVADARRVDVPSGNAVLTGIEVEVTAVR